MDGSQGKPCVEANCDAAYELLDLSTVAKPPYQADPYHQHNRGLNENNGVSAGQK